MDSNFSPSPRRGLGRRSFLRAALASAALASAALAPQLTRGAETTAPVSVPGKFSEPGRDLPLINDSDVIVCGAGPAGVAAAITAARGGARVRLFEREARDCPCQPMSLNALLVVKDASQLKPMLHDEDPKCKDNFLAEIQRAGFFPSYSKPTLWQIRDNLLLVMMNHEYGVKPFDAAEVTAATVRARSEMNKIVNGLRGLGGIWEGVQLVATAEQIGVRDGRRIRGRYVVTAEDVIAGARHEDAVVRPTFSVDIHALSEELNKTAAYGNSGIKVKPYDIPLRALIARDVDGLLMAGRCISGDFIAHASYRVTGNATAMG